MIYFYVCNCLLGTCRFVHFCKQHWQHIHHLKESFMPLLCKKIFSSKYSNYIIRIIFNKRYVHAKSFVSSCEEKLRYRLHDTFLADVFTSRPSPLPPIQQVIPAQSPRERELRYCLSDTFLHDLFTSEPSQLPMTNREGPPKLAVQQHVPTVSHVNTMVVCGAVAHHVKPCQETSPFEATLGRHNQANNNDVTPSSLGPEQKGHTPVNEPV